MPIDQIRDMLARELGGPENVPAEVKNAVIDEIGGLVLQRLAMLMYAQLSEKDRDTFVALQEKKDASGMQAFITQKVPNLAQLTEEALQAEIKAFTEFQKTLPQE